MAICGRPDIGAILRKATTGCPAHGLGRLKWACCGRLDIGDIPKVGIATTTVFGAGILATTAALTMDSATSAPGIRADTGTEIVSITTVQLTM